MSDIEQVLEKLNDFRVEVVGKLATIEAKQNNVSAALADHLVAGAKRAADIEARVDNHDGTIRRIRDIGVVLHLLWLSILAYFSATHGNK